MCNHQERKRLVSTLFILAFLSCFVLAKNGPKIKFKEETRDFGKTKQGAVLSHVFEFFNAGDSLLLIKNVRTSCGCTAALVSDKKIEPGKKGEIKISFDTRGYGGDVAKYVYVESNDPSEPTKQLTVQASIDVPPRPLIELDTYSLDIGLLLEDEEIQAKVKVMNKGEQVLNVTFSHKDASFFKGQQKISAALEIAAGKEEDIEIRIPSQGRKSLLREYILFQSNDPMRPNLSLYLSGYIVTKKQLKDLFAKYGNIIK